MQKQKPPTAQPESAKIEFPCDYPIKVMGDAGDALYQHVMVVMERHAPGFSDNKITIKDSSKGRFQSITVVITATGQPQLEAIFADLKTHSAVKMVL